MERLFEEPYLKEPFGCSPNDVVAIATAQQKCVYSEKSMRKSSKGDCMPTGGHEPLSKLTAATIVA